MVPIGIQVVCPLLVDFLGGKWCVYLESGSYDGKVPTLVPIKVGFDPRGWP